MPNRFDLAKTLRVLLAVFLAVLVWALCPYTRESALHIKVFLCQWFAFVCLGTLLLGSWLVRERLHPPQRFAVLIAAFAVLQFAAVSVSANREYSFFEFTKWASLLIFFFTASYAYRTPEQVWRLLLVFCAAMAVSSVYGFAQFFGLDPIAWAAQHPITRQGPSTFGNPNIAAHALLPAIVFSSGLVARKKARWPAVFLAMFLAHLAIARTRAAVVGLSLALVFAAIYMAARKIWRTDRAVLVTFGAAGAIAVAGAAAVFGGTYLRTGSPYPFDTSLVLRYHSFYGACRMIADAPFLGRGPGGYLLSNPSYWTDLEKERFASLNKMNDHVHNEPLEFGVDAGLAPGMLYVVLLVLGGAAALGLARDSMDRDGRVLGLTVSAFCAGYAVDSLFGFNAHVPVSAVLLFLTLGVVSGITCRPGAHADDATGHAQGPRAAGPRLAWRVAVLVAACIIPLMGTRAFLSQYYQQRGHGAAAWGVLDAATANFAHAAALTPYDWSLYLHAGTASLMQGKPEEGVFWFTQCVALNPSYVPGLLGMAQAKFNVAVQSRDRAQKTGLLDEAVQYASRALGYCPGLARAHDLLGRVATMRAWQHGRTKPRDADTEKPNPIWRKAETDLVRAIESGAEDEEKLYQLLAQARMGLDDIDGAEQAYAAAVQAAPDDRETWALFDQFAQANGRYQSLLDMLNWRLWQLARAPMRDMQAWGAASLRKAAVLERAYADPWGAVNAYRDAALAEPARRATWPAFYQSAQSPREKALFQSTLLMAYDALSAAGQPVPAELCAAAAGLRGAPEAIKDVTAQLFDILEQRETGGKAPSAGKDLVWVVDLMLEKVSSPAFPEPQRGSALFDLGRSLCAMGEYERGETLLGEAQPLLEGAGLLQCVRLRAQALLATNNAAEAISLLRRALRSAPDDVTLRHMLAKALVQDGDADAARFEYQLILGSPSLSQEGRELIEAEYQALDKTTSRGARKR